MRLRTTRVLGGRRTKVPNHRSIDRNNDVAFLEVPGRRRHRSIRHPTPNRLCSVFITGLEGSPCSASSSHSSKDGKRYKTPCRLFPSFLCLPSRPTTSRFLSSLRLNPPSTTTTTSHTFHETPKPTNDEIHDHFGYPFLRFYNHPRRSGEVRGQGCLGPKDPRTYCGDHMGSRENLLRRMGSRPGTRERHEPQRHYLPIQERTSEHQCVNMSL